MKTILLTGINGFVGRDIALYLQTHAADIMLIGTDIQPDCQAPCDKYYCIDIVKDLLALQCSADAIIHCAAKIHGTEEELFSSNVVGSAAVVAFAMKTKCQNVIYISSIQVIGKPTGILMDESAPTHPNTYYHKTKKIGEDAILLLNDVGIHAAVLRIAAPISKFRSNNSFLYRVMLAAADNEQITVFGKGQRVQNYLDTRDLSSAVLAAIHHNASGLYHLPGKSISNANIVEAIIATFHSSSDILFTGIDTEEDDRWFLSGEKAMLTFGYQMKHCVLDTIRELKSTLEGGNADCGLF